MAAPSRREPAAAGQRLGYARVSTLEQDPTLQLDALTAAGVDRVFTDHASGTLAARPQLGELMDRLRPGDTLVVWRLDRLGRSTAHLLATVEELGSREWGSPRSPRRSTPPPPQRAGCCWGYSPPSPPSSAI